MTLTHGERSTTQRFTVHDRRPAGAVFGTAPGLDADADRDRRER